MDQAARRTPEEARQFSTQAVGREKLCAPETVSCLSRLEQYEQKGQRLVAEAKGLPKIRSHDLCLGLSMFHCLWDQIQLYRRAFQHCAVSPSFISPASNGDVQLPFYLNAGHFLPFTHLIILLTSLRMPFPSIPLKEIHLLPCDLNLKWPPHPHQNPYSHCLYHMPRIHDLPCHTLYLSFLHLVSQNIGTKPYTFSFHSIY